MIDNLYYGQPINWADPLNRGLVSRWMVVPWYRGGPRWVDLCNKNHGTLTSMDLATAWSPKTHTGGFGSLAFDGSDDYVGKTAFPNVPLPATFLGWFNVAETASEVIVSHFDTGNDGYRAHVISTLYLVFGGVAVYDSGIAISTNTWTFFSIAITGNGGNARFNVGTGGPLTNATSAVGTPSGTPANLAVGRRGDATDFLSGMVSRIDFFNRALSDSEVRELYLDSLAGSPRTLSRIPNVAKFGRAAAATTYYNRLTLMGCGV